MGAIKIQYHKPTGISGLELLTCQETGYCFPPHMHSAYCVWLNTSCSEHYIHSGANYMLTPGCFGIIAPGEIHSNQACKNNSRDLLTLYLDPKQLQDFVAQSADKSILNVELRTKFYNSPSTIQSLVNLNRILRNSISTLERQSVFLETIVRLARRYGTPPVKEMTVGFEKRRINQIIELFHARLEDDLSLEEVARLFDCTPYHLIRFFKKGVGLTPHAYLIQLRLERVKLLLNQGESITDATFQTGFVDQSHLTRHFKNRFGIPPGIYQRQIQSPK